MIPNSTDGQSNVTKFILGLAASATALSSCGTPQPNDREEKHAARAQAVGAIEGILAEGKLPASSYIRVAHYDVAKSGNGSSVIYLNDPNLTSKLSTAERGYFRTLDFEPHNSNYNYENGQVTLVVGNTDGTTACTLQFDNAAGQQFLGAVRSMGEAQHPASQADIRRLCDTVNTAGHGVRLTYEGPTLNHPPSPTVNSVTVNGMAVTPVQKGEIAFGD